MPDHVHLLVAGRTAGANLIEFAKRAKQTSGYYAKRISGQPLWSTGYYERIVRHDEDPQRYVDYIVFNPIKARLADAVGVHPHTWVDTQ